LLLKHPVFYLGFGASGFFGSGFAGPLEGGGGGGGAGLFGSALTASDFAPTRVALASLSRPSLLNAPFIVSLLLYLQIPNPLSGLRTRWCE